jgi:predicted lipoprotein
VRFLAVVDNRASVQNACEKAHVLEILLKVDVASALGVTLTFSSTDGD